MAIKLNDAVATGSLSLGNSGRSDLRALEAHDELPPDWQQQDSIGSYNVAVAAIGEQVRAGAPVPEFMRSRRSEAAE